MLQTSRGGFLFFSSVTAQAPTQGVLFNHSSIARNILGVRKHTRTHTPQDADLLGSRSAIQEALVALNDAPCLRTRGIKGSRFLVRLHFLSKTHSQFFVTIIYIFSRHLADIVHKFAIPLSYILQYTRTPQFFSPLLKPGPHSTAIQRVMSYKVYQIRYTIAIPDPDMPSPRYHHVIFVETDDNGGGIIHHVTGDITSGMSYDTKRGRRPEDSESFYAKSYLGVINKADYPHQMDQVLRKQPPPPKQKHFNIKTMKTEQIKPDGTFYAPGEPRPPMIKCTEWTVNQAIPALYDSGILRQ